MTDHSTRRAAATSWLANYHGSIDSTALVLAHEAGQRAAEAAAVKLAESTAVRTLEEAAAAFPVTTRDMVSRSSVKAWLHARARAA